jgi:predicted nuclease of predicted toxin-antitoxin system
VSLALYMDVHVPAAITRGLRRRGVEVVTAQEDGTTRLEDPDLLDRASTLGRILFTRDEDLLAVAAERLRGGKTFASVVFARQLEVSIGRCVADLEVIAKAGLPEEARNHVIYLPL